MNNPCDYGGEIVDCQRPATWDEQRQRWLCEKHTFLRAHLDKTLPREPVARG